MMPRWSAASLVLSAFSACQAVAATPFGLDDYYQLASVSEPAFSPAGDRVAYTVSLSDKKRDESTSDLWMVPWSGGKPVQLTRTPKSSEWQPRYGGDGKSLFFLCDAGKRDDDEEATTQLWRMSAIKGVFARCSALRLRAKSALLRSG